MTANLQTKNAGPSNASLPIVQNQQYIEEGLSSQQLLPKTATELQILESQFQMPLHNCSEEVKTEISYILSTILEYPSSSQAILHQNANRLGRFDIISSTHGATKIHPQHEERKSEVDDEKNLCKDCGLVIQTEEIPICTSLQQFPKVGIATFLCFQNVKNLLVLLILLAAMYCAYSLSANINEPNMTLDSNNFPKKLSFASIVQNLSKNNSLYDTMQIEGWLVFGTVGIWWIAIFIIRFYEIKQQRLVDDTTITAADFSIMFEHVPVTYKRQDLQRDLNAYYQELKDRKDLHNMDELRPFTIHKFCRAVPFYFLDDESIKEKIEEIQNQISEKRQKIADFIVDIKEKGKFSKGQADRKLMYENFEKLCADKKHQEQLLVELSIKEDYMDQQGIKTAIFVSFRHSQTANVINEVNPQGFSARLRYYLSCCKNGLFFKMNEKDGEDVFVNRAPEPEDIIWENIGIPDDTKVRRKILTYAITLLLLGASFGIVYGLTILQETYKSSIISIAISLSITVINIVIGVAIRKLTVYESDITSTNLQISLAIKSIFAQLMNSTIVPVVTNLYVENNLYEVNGLVYDIFFLAITSSFLPPVLKLLDIPYLIKKITIWYYNQPFQKLSLSQEELNKIYEHSEFELGVAQIYYIDLFYFTCFYVHVHPFIIVFTVLGFALMYWAQKRSLLFHSRRPTPSSALLNEVIGKLIAFSPCVLSFGSLFWYNIIRQDYHNFSSLVIISRIAAIAFAVFFFLVPFSSVFNVICYIPDDEVLDYEEVKGQLTSQYSLTNPVTAGHTLGEMLKIESGNKEQKLMKRMTKQFKLDEENTGIIRVSSKLEEQEDTFTSFKREDSKKPLNDYEKTFVEDYVAREDNKPILSNPSKPKRNVELKPIRQVQEKIKETIQNSPQSNSVKNIQI